MVISTQKIESNMSNKMGAQPSLGHQAVSISDDTLAIVPAKKRENSSDNLIPSRRGTSATGQEKKDPHGGGGGPSREAAEALVKKFEQKLIAREAESAAILRYLTSIVFSYRRLPFWFFVFFLFTLLRT